MLRSLAILLLVACTSPSESTAVQHVEEPPRCEDLGCSVWEIECDDPYPVDPYKPNCVCTDDYGEHHNEPCIWP